MNIDFLFQRIGIKCTSTSITALLLLFLAFGLIHDIEVYGCFCFSIACIGLVTLPIFMVLIGVFKILRGETTFKNILVISGIGFAVFYISILLPIFRLLLPFVFLTLFYGIGGYIGYRIQKYRNRDLTTP